MNVPHSLHASFTLGFLGAGQLARMSALQALRFGVQIAAYSDRHENEPLQLMTPHHVSGAFDDLEALTQFANRCDLITLENEFIDSDILRQLEQQTGTPILPSPESFSLVENKRIEKETFERAGIPVTPWGVVEGRGDLEAFGHQHGWPFLLKSSKGGYDGYGNETVRNIEEAVEGYRKLGGENGHEIIAEAFVEFTHELAVQVARNGQGTVVYPCCETVQENHICVAVKSPAPVDPVIRKRAQEMATAATEAIDGIGIYAFELFLQPDGELLLNESAPRPHNSGHYTIEGCVTSQFENHIRAVLDLPLGPTDLRQPAAVMANILGSHQRPAQVDHAGTTLSMADAHLHIYGKLRSKPGRKMGHVTLLGDDLEALYRRSRELASEIEI